MDCHAYHELKGVPWLLRFNGALDVLKIPWRSCNHLQIFSSVIYKGEIEGGVEEGIEGEYTARISPQMQSSKFKNTITRSRRDT